MPYCMFPGGCLWLVGVTFLCLPLLLLCMLGVGSLCMGTDAVNLFLHTNVAGWPRFWINHSVFSLRAFGLGGGGRERVDVFDFFFFIIIIWSKEAETCLEVFQLPVFLFWPNFPVNPLPTLLSLRGNRKLCLYVSLKQPAAWIIKITENTQFAFSRQGGGGECWFPYFFLLLQGHWCSKQTTHLKIGSVNASSQIQFQATATCLTARVWDYLWSDSRRAVAG